MPDNFNIEHIKDLPYIVNACPLDKIEAEVISDLISYDSNHYDCGMESLKEDLVWSKEMEECYPWLPKEERLLPYLIKLIDWRKEKVRFKKGDFKTYNMYYPTYYVNLFSRSHIKALDRRSDDL